MILNEDPAILSIQTTYRVPNIVGLKEHWAQSLARKSLLDKLEVAGAQSNWKVGESGRKGNVCLVCLVSVFLRAAAEKNILFLGWGLTFFVYEVCLPQFTKGVFTNWYVEGWF